MKIGLCMVVRNEAHQILPCLAPIVDAFDEVAIVDTGSTDGTPDVVRREFGITLLAKSLDRNRCNCLCDARIAALAQLSTPWVMMLDADERVDRPAIDALRAMRDDEASAGYFGAWMNHVDGSPPFEDYKLFLFRNGVRPRGLVHDVAQHDIRARGLRARWLAQLTVQHFPDPARRLAKAASYRERLSCAIAREPSVPRYHWFLGYMEFLDGRFDRAVHWLERAAGARSNAFPVESLNSAMVLADIHARHGDASRLRAILNAAIEFHASVADDFEVAVNTRLGPWLSAARAHAQAGTLDAIRAYRFAC